MLRDFLRKPIINSEKKNLLQARWDALPRELKIPNQLTGKTSIACGATHHVMERCNFSCTCCYLGAEANKTEALPFIEVKKQLDTLRHELGPGGKVQITAGEVTLLPLQELGEIIKYALSIDLDPMVMSHGQRFIEEPEYLISLVREYGLRKISIHIDTTQRGRKRTNSKMLEKDLHFVRDEFANLIRRVRLETGSNLKAASTVTVTDSNLEEVAEITRWFYDNADAFRLLSFLPVADVGRTRKAQGSLSVERDGLWAQIYQASGQIINRRPLQFGHRKCNNLVPLLLAQVGSERIILEGVREGNQKDALMLSQAIDTIGSEVNWAEPWNNNIKTLASIFLTHPLFLLQTLKYTVYRIYSDRQKVMALYQAILNERRLPELRPFLFIIHNFMSPKDLLTEEGKERLDACIFKVPVDGKLISMCEMNATDLRAKIDRLQIQKTKQQTLVEA